MLDVRLGSGDVLVSRPDVRGLPSLLGRVSLGQQVHQPLVSFGCDIVLALDEGDDERVEVFAGDGQGDGSFPAVELDQGQVDPVVLDPDAGTSGHRAEGCFGFGVSGRAAH